MEPERTLPLLQPPATCSRTEPDQSSPVDTSPSLFLNTHFNSILPSTPRTSKWSLSFRCPQEIVCAPLLSSRRATCPSNLILDPIELISGKDYNHEIPHSTVFFYLSVTSSLAGSDFFLSTLLCSCSFGLRCGSMRSRWFSHVITRADWVSYSPYLEGWQCTLYTYTEQRVKMPRRTLTSPRQYTKQTCF